MKYENKGNKFESPFYLDVIKLLCIILNSFDLIRH